MTPEAFREMIEGLQIAKMVNIISDGEWQRIAERIHKKYTNNGELKKK